MTADVQRLCSKLTNLSAYSWQYSATTNDWISANPILEMRTALDQALGAPSPGYSAGLAQGQPIKAIHIQELRDRVLAAWSTGSAGTEINWLVADHLGTPRMIIDQTGSLANVKRHDYLPFGEELFAGQGGRTMALGYSGDNVRQKFTSYERDNETGLDFAQARYYSNLQGRFTSSDPYNIVLETQFASDAKEARSQFLTYLSNPQRWSRYHYSLNNPLLYTDPKGEDVTIFYRPREEGAGSTADQGHLFIYVRNDETGESAYFDYIAEGDINNLGTTQLNQVTQGRINKHASLTIETSANQEQAILNGIQDMYKSAPDYDVKGLFQGGLKQVLIDKSESTCTSNSIKLLALGGINVGARPQSPANVWISAVSPFGRNHIEEYRPRKRADMGKKVRWPWAITDAYRIWRKKS